MVHYNRVLYIHVMLLEIMVHFWFCNSLFNAKTRPCCWVINCFSTACFVVGFLRGSYINMLRLPMDCVIFLGLVPMYYVSFLGSSSLLNL